MTVEARPYGQFCTASCEYCYNALVRAENPWKGRPNGRMTTEEWLAFKQTMLCYNEAPILFGGDPGVLSREELEDWFRFTYGRWGQGGAQTWGWWLDEDWIPFLRQHNVHLGLSIDGPWPLNRPRMIRDEENTKLLTDKVIGLIPKLRVGGVGVSVISTLHKENASPERLPLLKEWLTGLNKQGISGRLHPLEIDTPAGAAIALSMDELIKVMLDLARFFADEQSRSRWFSPFKDIMDMWRGRKNVVCSFGTCDPFATVATTAVDPDGASSCGRGFKDGIRLLRDDPPRMTRYTLLERTPQEYGGCRGCQWWPLCHGGCPGSAIDKDWRNRTEFCALWKALFEFYEEEFGPPAKGKPQEQGNQVHGDHTNHGDAR